MSEKTGSWFIELILNILLLASTAFVTFAAKGEQDRRALALVTPVPSASTAAASPQEDALPSASNPQPPAVTPLPPAVAPVPPSTATPLGVTPAPAANLPQSNTPAVVPPPLSYQQAVGALGIWAAGLDGAITSNELEKIKKQVGDWRETIPLRDYLKNINDQINAGKGDEIVRRSLESLGSQAYDKKIQATTWLVDSMKNNGMSWEKINSTVSSWMTDYLKLKPLDLWSSLKP